MTPTRQKKIQAVMKHRQPTLVVVLENIDDPHNVGAILRSCDAFGVGEVYLLYTGDHRAPLMRELKSKSAASAAKWLRITRYSSCSKLITELKKKKFHILTTGLGVQSVDMRQADMTRPIAIVLGNEHEGVSSVLLKKADVNVRIPMFGFVQSFNVSVAAALLLYEAVRQRNLL